MLQFGGFKDCIGPHRLTVRTPGSHPGNSGSIPDEVTSSYLTEVDRTVMQWFNISVKNSLQG